MENTIPFISPLAWLLGSGSMGLNVVELVATVMVLIPLLKVLSDLFFCGYFLGPDIPLWFKIKNAQSYLF